MEIEVVGNEMQSKMIYFEMTVEIMMHEAQKRHARTHSKALDPSVVGTKVSKQGLQEQASHEIGR